jgi:hypothetical protein
MKNKKTKQEVSILKEKFLVEYCKKMGWNHNELSTSQMLFITQQKDYISPTNQ